jgi:hypothetical protein
MSGSSYSEGSESVISESGEDFHEGKNITLVIRRAEPEILIPYFGWGYHLAGQQLALVGRDIATDLPLENIPLMKRIAELSVKPFERRL